MPFASINALTCQRYNSLICRCRHRYMMVMVLSNHCAATHIHLFIYITILLLLLLLSWLNGKYTRKIHRPNTFPSKHFLFVHAQSLYFQFSSFCDVIVATRTFSPPFRWQGTHREPLWYICLFAGDYYHWYRYDRRRVCHVCIWYLLHDYCHFDWVDLYVHFPYLSSSQSHSSQSHQTQRVYVSLSLSLAPCPLFCHYGKINIVIELRQKWIKLLNDFVTRALGFGWLNITNSPHTFDIIRIVVVCAFCSASKAKKP